MNGVLRQPSPGPKESRDSGIDSPTLIDSLPWAGKRRPPPWNSGLAEKSPILRKGISPALYAGTADDQTFSKRVCKLRDRDGEGGGGRMHEDKARKGEESRMT